VVIEEREAATTLHTATTMVEAFRLVDMLIMNALFNGELVRGIGTRSGDAAPDTDYEVDVRVVSMAGDVIKSNISFTLPGKAVL
jgi:hypothetical protein